MKYSSKIRAFQRREAATWQHRDLCQPRQPSPEIANHSSRAAETRGVYLRIRNGILQLFLGKKEEEEAQFGNLGERLYYLGDRSPSVWRRGLHIKKVYPLDPVGTTCRQA